MKTRRKFIKETACVSAGVLAGISAVRAAEDNFLFSTGKKPLVLSTWDHGLAANEAAWKILSGGGRALDAVERGVMVSESDPNVDSVGYGGLPDRDGNVTLDACIMDESGNCGSVAFLQHIMNPVSVARMIMEKTPHIMLVGEGALQFALANGFKKENLLTDKAKKLWEEWVKTTRYLPFKKTEQGHDTIGMVAIDMAGNLSGACTTSGLSWKYHGRVGDSPIIGAGLYVDNEVGGASATGKGEAVIKICGSHLIVELMRNGKTPQKACEEAVYRIVKKQKDFKDFQVGFLAVSKNGEIGAFSIKKGFQYALYLDGKNQLFDANFYLK
jgi:isoaspartyl peptidase/L-asparaginase-like protein (Ntn-hydrolase superfamily)